MLDSILVFIKYLFIIVGYFFERKTEKKKLKKEALDELKDALQKRDSSRITAIFDRINRM